MATVYKRGGKGSKGTYYVAWTDHTGRRRSKAAGTTDKATAQRIAARLEDEAAKRREGLIDADAEAFAIEADRPIAEHLQDYRAKLEAAGRSAQHVDRTATLIATVSECCGFDRLREIEPDAVNRYANGLRENGRAPRTVQSHLAAITSFTRWLFKRQRVPRDPLASVTKPNPKAGRRRERRVLQRDEWAWLRDTTVSAPAR